MLRRWDQCARPFCCVLHSRLVFKGLFSYCQFCCVSCHVSSVPPRAFAVPFNGSTLSQPKFLDNCTWANWHIFVHRVHGKQFVHLESIWRFYRASRTHRISTRDTRFHDLRHTHASELLRSGVPLENCLATSRTCQSTVTLNIYAHVMSGDDERAAETVEKMIKKQLEKKGGKKSE